MDLTSTASSLWPNFPSGWDLYSSVLQIVLIDLVLAGDNAVIIALAVKTLPRRQRLFGMTFGAGFAVLLRVALTFFAAHLLQISYVKFIGGVLIYWIGCKLLLEDVAAPKQHHGTASFGHAIWMIVIGDVTMSTDNILALAGASRGSIPLLLFGLALSIPLVVGASSLLSRLMDKYPIIIYLGAAVLGKVSAEMIFTDPAVSRFIQLPDGALYVMEAVFAFSVVGLTTLYMRWFKPATAAPSTSNVGPEAAASLNASEPYDTLSKSRPGVHRKARDATRQLPPQKR